MQEKKRMKIVRAAIFHAAVDRTTFKDLQPGNSTILRITCLGVLLPPGLFQEVPGKGCHIIFNLQLSSLEPLFAPVVSVTRQNEHLGGWRMVENGGEWWRMGIRGESLFSSLQLHSKCTPLPFSIDVSLFVC